MKVGKRRRTTGAVLVVMAVLLLAALTAGCGSTAAGTETSATVASTGSQTTISSPSSDSASASTTTAVAETGTFTITDDAGRQVTLPKQINKIFSTSPMGTIFVYTLAPEKLLAWNSVQSDEIKQFLAPGVRDLPNLSGWYAANTANAEDIVAAKPDFILSLSSSDPKTDTSTISQCDELQAQLGIPFVILDGRMDKVADTYELVGKWTGDEERAQELAAYCRTALQDITTKAATIPADKKVRVYYAEGTDGLQTEGTGSAHAALIPLVGAINVADIPAAKGVGGAGMSEVSMEQVLKWNPDVIIVGISMGSSNKSVSTTDAYSLITSGERSWNAVNAVKNKKVYAMPTVPFSWLDRPPSVNRFIGMEWLANLLYPDVYQYNITAETKNFYKLFYHVDITDAQVQQLLARSK